MLHIADSSFLGFGRQPETRASAPGHGPGRIGNWVPEAQRCAEEIPDGSAAVTDDDGPKHATAPHDLRAVRRGQRMTPKSEDLLARAHQSPAPSRLQSAKKRGQPSRLTTEMRTLHGFPCRRPQALLRTRHPHQQKISKPCRLPSPS
jgi:hypothetical protein